MCALDCCLAENKIGAGAYQGHGRFLGCCPWVSHSIVPCWGSLICVWCAQHLSLWSLPRPQLSHCCASPSSWYNMGQKCSPGLLQHQLIQSDPDPNTWYIDSSEKLTALQFCMVQCRCSSAHFFHTLRLFLGMNGTVRWIWGPRPSSRSVHFMVLIETRASGGQKHHVCYHLWGDDEQFVCHECPVHVPFLVPISLYIPFHTLLFDFIDCH